MMISALPNTVLAVLLAFLLPLLGVAQGYNISRYSLNEGLTQSQVLAIFQDHRGFMWLGTHRGICRFDGKSFEDWQQEDGLSGRFVNAITEDKAGSIWIGTENGLSRFDGIRFQNFNAQNGLTTATVLSLLCDTNGRIWIGTQGGGVFVYENQKISPLQSSIAVDVRSIAEDKPSGRIWLGTNAGLFFVEGKQIQKAKGVAELSINTLLPDARVGLWLGTNKGIVRYQNNRPIFFTQQLPDKNIHCLVLDSDRQLWAGTGSGILRLQYENKGEMGAQVLSETFRHKNWSEQSVVKAALKDYEGNLWFGTEGEGVFKIRKGLFSVFRESEGMNTKIAKTFLEDKKGTIWIGTTNNGINLYDPATNTFSYLTKEQSQLKANDICAAYADSKGGFWFMTYDHGIAHFEDNKFNYFSVYQGLSSDHTFCGTEDKQGKMWFGTDKGVNVWDGKQFTYYNKQNGLISDIVYCITHDSKGNVWFGTPSGISCMSAVGGVRNFTTRDSLADNLVLKILEDDKGNIWAATSRGISIWNGAKWRKIPIPGNSAANDVVSMLFERNSHNLWLGTNYGVFKMDLGEYEQKGTYTFEHFTNTDGLPSLECNGNAIFQDSKDNIWIGTVEGAVRYNQTATNGNSVQLKSYLTNVRLFFKDIKQESGWFDGINPETGLPQNLSLPYNQNHLTFDFIGICYSKPSAIRYQIRLDGFDKDWLPLTDETKFTYSNLPHGNYKLHIRATHNLREWVEAAPFSFRIRPPFWLTWWFALMVLGTMGLVAWGIYEYLKERQRQRREREEVQNKADMLQLEQQALYAMMNPHFTFNALQSIQYYIHTQDKVSATKFLTQFAKLVRMNLDSSKSEFISLHDEIERLKLYMSLEKMRFQDKFEYEISLDPDIDKSETQVPPMILQPFVENSLKHGIMPLKDRMGHIQVHISSLDADSLQVEISDNGIGIEASKKMKENRPTDHVSRGMKITQDRLKLFSKTTHKAYSFEFQTLKTEAGEVAGTKVVILLPAKGWD